MLPVSSREERDRPSRSRWNQDSRGAGDGRDCLGLALDALGDRDLAGDRRGGGRRGVGVAGGCERRRKVGRRGWRLRLGLRAPSRLPEAGSARQFADDGASATGRRLRGIGEAASRAGARRRLRRPRPVRSSALRAPGAARAPAIGCGELRRRLPAPVEARLGAGAGSARLWRAAAARLPRCAVSAAGAARRSASRLGVGGRRSRRASGTPAAARTAVGAAASQSIGGAARLAAARLPCCRTKRPS